MASAKRSNDSSGVAASQFGRRKDDFFSASADIYGFGPTVEPGSVNDFVDDVFAKYKAVLTDTNRPSVPDFSVLEAFSKLDTSSSLGSKTRMAVRILTTEDRTEGVRVLCFSASKDQTYGPRAGYKKVPVEEFALRDDRLTRGFIIASINLGLDLSFYENPETYVIRAAGSRTDATVCCQVLVEYAKSKTTSAVFRRALKP